MNADVIDFFIHDRSQPARPARGQPEETLESALCREGVVLDKDVNVFITPPGDEDVPEGSGEAGEDDAEPVSLHLSLIKAGLKPRGHVHCHPCRKVLVTVNYQSHSKQHSFPPSVPIRRVRQWALKKFELSGPAASDFVLQPCGSDKDAGLQQHLAEFVSGTECSACFDLVKEVTPQG